MKAKLVVGIFAAATLILVSGGSLAVFAADENLALESAKTLTESEPMKDDKYPDEWDQEDPLNYRAYKQMQEESDILVNNAGVSESTPFLEYTEETFDRVMDLNIKGVFNASRAAAEDMAKRGGGVILSTSSMVSISGQPGGVAYPASKFAVNGLTISLARELGPKGIRVNAVAPGITETDMMKAVPKEVIDPLIAQIPLRRLGQPEDIANAFVFLASDEASYITGVVLSVDGMARA